MNPSSLLREREVVVESTESPLEKVLVYLQHLPYCDELRGCTCGLEALRATLDPAMLQRAREKRQAINRATHRKRP